MTEQQTNKTVSLPRVRVGDKKAISVTPIITIGNEIYKY